MNEVEENIVTDIGYDVAHMVSSVETIHNVVLHIDEHVLDCEQGMQHDGEAVKREEIHLEVIDKGEHENDDYDSVLIYFMSNFVKLNF